MFKDLFHQKRQMLLSKLSSIDNEVSFLFPQTVNGYRTEENRFRATLKLYYILHNSFQGGSKNLTIVSFSAVSVELRKLMQFTQLHSNYISKILVPPSVSMHDFTFDVVRKHNEFSLGQLNKFHVHKTVIVIVMYERQFIVNFFSEE